jgi:hypothetical protein
VRVTEPGLVDRHEVFFAAHAPAPMMARGGGAPPPQIEVEAADLDVTAAVEVTFTLE